MSLQKTTLLIDSTYRNNPNGTATSNFVYSLPSPIENVVNVHLRQCIIQNGVYNITDNNNTFTLFQNTDSTNNTTLINIPIGYYDSKTLMFVIGALLNSANTSKNSNDTLSQFFCDVNTLGTFQILNDSVRNWAIQFSAPYTTNTLLGFAVVGVYVPLIGTLNAPYVLQATQAIQLTNYDSILISSNQLGSPIQTNQGWSAFYSIPNGNLLTNSTTISYENTTPPQLDVRFNPKPISWVDIRIIDNRGQEVNLWGNDVTLLIDFYSKKT